MQTVSISQSFLVLWSLAFASAQSPVPMNFYTDQACADPSNENPVASVPLQECLVTTGLGSISIPSVPCESGNVELLAFQDTACGNQLSIMDWYKVTNTCAARFKGDIAAILLTCNQENDAGTISVGDVTATSTILVGSVANAAATATPSAGSSSGTVATATATPAPSAGTQSAGSSSTVATATATPAPSAGTQSAGSASGAVATPTSSTAPSASTVAPSGSGSASDSPTTSGLSTSDKIALGVGIGCGVPPIILGLIAIKRRFHRRTTTERLQM